MEGPLPTCEKTEIMYWQYDAPIEDIPAVITELTKSLIGMIIIVMMVMIMTVGNNED